MFGAREAAWPLIRQDLHLTYAAIGLLLSVPELVAAAIEPLTGLLADTGRRRMLVTAGGVFFAASLLLTGLAGSFGVLLLAFMLAYPASGAFVSLSQASLMDMDPDRRETSMARWVLAGSIGASAGPLFLLAMVGTGHGWRGVFLLLAAITVPLVLLAGRVPGGDTEQITLWAGLRAALAALRTWRVLRWLILLDAGNLMGDVLTGYLALYMVDVARVNPAEGGAAVIVLTLANLGGDALLLPLLSRMPGARYMRISAAAVLVLYPAFLLAPGFPAKLMLLALVGVLRAGWYAIPQAGLYAEIPEKSGSVLVLANVGGVVASCFPVAFGLLAERAGFAAAMWLLLLGPVALLVLTRGVPAGTAQPGD